MMKIRGEQARERISHGAKKPEGEMAKGRKSHNSTFLATTPRR